ncbi:hypothetical protein M3I53_33970 [Paraburkholderia sp. CNPSo 3272]|uniref:hypothetical protein n=1 Tax=Paraburkholderia sp. CNPSo 3272 TaxID=2940931 RepID=UPI0020B64F7D|nr:hypothetical protein [Paraburkholderia sp. CNPSo 3272]MCP3728065.1 hypothetical protein [Paraburkholderia sp. CNPSo 3272]
MISLPFPRLLQRLATPTRARAACRLAVLALAATAGTTACTQQTATVATAPTAPQPASSPRAGLPQAARDMHSWHGVALDVSSIVEQSSAKAA